MVSIVKRMTARYEADVSSFERGIATAAQKHEAFAKKVVHDTDKVKKTTDSAGDSVVLLGHKFGGMSPVAAKHVNDVVQATSRMKLALVGAAGVVSGIMATAFVSLGDQAKQVDNQLRGIGAASDEARAKVYALAIETRTPLEATIGLLRSMQKSLSTQSLDQTLRQVGTLNRLLTIGGLDAGQRGSVALQFGQALQSGVLQGDELRALRESAPFELMDAIAKRAGGTVESLRDLGSQGKLTRDVMVGALEDLEATSREKFGDFQMTVADAMTVFNTSLIGAVGEIDSAVGATDALANALAGMAGFLRDHIGAVATLASALATLAQFALLAAGARGLTALAAPLGAVTGGIRALGLAFGSMTNVAVTAAAAQQALVRGLGGLMSMLGGPYGVAIFAATSATLLLAKAFDSFKENVDQAIDGIKRLDEINTTIETLRTEMVSDGEKLEDINKRIAEAIKSQATEAEATAARDKAAVEGRIAKNQELLNIQRELARQTLLQTRQDVDTAKAQLALRTRPTWELESGAFVATDDEVLRAERDRLMAKSRAGESWSEREIEWFREYEALSTLIDDVRKKEQSHADQAANMANAHVLAWKKRQDAIEATAKAESDAVEALNKKSVERDAKLTTLQKQREAAQSRLNTLPRGADRVEALNAVAEADRQIAEIRKVEERVGAARDTVDALNETMARTGGVMDKDGKLRGLLDDIETRLEEAEQAGRDLDEVTLKNLESSVAGATVAAKNLKIELLSAASVDFDEIRRQMESGPAPYSTEMQNAVFANTNMVDYITRKEGMLHVAKYDENAWRAGYGTDKIYKRDESGAWSPHDVYEGMRVTQEEANYSLMKRLEEEFLPPIVAAIGQDRWNAMNDNQKAALASLSWNYGAHSWNDPGRLGGVAEAARSGSAQTTADAIARLALQQTKSEQREGNKGPDGKPMNYARRMEEAALFGDTEAVREQGDLITQQHKDRLSAEETLARKRKDYLASLTDEQEIQELSLSLNGKSIADQDRILQIHQEIAKAKESGLDVDAKMLNSELTLREAIIRKIDNEIQVEAERNARREVEREKEEAAALKAQRYQDQINEKKALQQRVEADIQQLIVGSLMKTGDWREAASRLLEQLAQAYLMAGLFNSGPLGEGDGKGLLGGFTSFLSGWLTQSADGNVMTEHGPIRLQRYALGGIARSPQLSLFGEGRQPEAYVPLPDGRSIPVTIKTPDVPSFSGGVGGNGVVRVVVDLNDELFKERVVETSGPVSAAISKEHVSNFSSHGLPSRVRRINKDPKRVR